MKTRKCIIRHISVNIKLWHYLTVILALTKNITMEELEITERKCKDPLQTENSKKRHNNELYSHTENI